MAHKIHVLDLFFGFNQALALAMLLQDSQERPLAHKHNTSRCRWGHCAYRSDHVNNCRHGATRASCKNTRCESDPRAKVVGVDTTTGIGLLVGNSASRGSAATVVGTYFATSKIGTGATVDCRYRYIIIVGCCINTVAVDYALLSSESWW